ncbi:MAG TPA: tetratricopeptide repeat protein, partial [Longimicrobiales bacterium]|nr:tetratricopeptide repeat protein [Longimicrobiales bacterium]
MLAYAALLTVLLPLQHVPSARGVLQLARQQSTTDAQLARIARDQTDTLRAAFSLALQETSLKKNAAEKAVTLMVAQRLAHAYAVVWHDPFLVHETARFQTRTAAQQRERVRSDSLRRAGNTALTSAGVPTAMRLWSASLRSATNAHDSVAQAAALGNLGAGFYREGKLVDAENHLTRSRNMASTMGDLRTAGTAIGILASLYRDRGDLAKSIEHYQWASALRERTGDTRGLAADRNNQGMVARDLGDIAGAKAAFKSSLALNTKLRRSAPASVNLLNLAGIGSMLGEYTNADALYTQALELQRRNGDAAESAFTLHERGLLRVRRGDYAAAYIDLRDAAIAHEQAGAALDAADVRRDIATLLITTGDPQRALTTLREAEATANKAHAPPSMLADFALAQGDLALAMSAYEEASDYYTSAQRLFSKARDDRGLGKAAEARAGLLYVREDYAQAVAALRGAKRAYERGGDTRGSSMAQLSIGYAELASGDLNEAERSIAAARNGLLRLGDDVGEVATLIGLGDVAMARGSPQLADSHYRTGLEKLGDRFASDLRWRLHAGRGSALRAQRALPAAAQQFRAAIKEIERSSSTLTSAERRTGFLTDKFDVYGELALTERGRGDIAAAFAASERMRAQQILGLVSHGRIPTSRATVGQEQDLRRQIGELMKAVDHGTSTSANARESNAGKRADAPMREALYRAQSRYARLLTDMHSADAGYADIVNPRLPALAAIAKHLKDDEVMVDYLATDSTTIAFVITASGVSLIDLSISRDQLAPRIDFAVRLIQKVGKANHHLWRAPLTRLYGDLITPLEDTGLLKGKRSLIIVPHGELHFLPFAALIDPGNSQFLVNRWNISYAPSASVWLRLRQGSKTRSRNVVVMSPREDVLPYSRLEVNNIKQIYRGGAHVLSGKSASIAGLRASL